MHSPGDMDRKNRRNHRAEESRCRYESLGKNGWEKRAEQARSCEFLSRGKAAQRSFGVYSLPSLSGRYLLTVMRGV